MDNRPRAPTDNRYKDVTVTPFRPSVTLTFARRLLGISKVRGGVMIDTQP